MKVLIVGGVAAGTKTAAKLKRIDRDAEVTLITKDREISYAGCGLPYYVGGLIETEEELVVNTPQKYAALTGVAVVTGMEATALDAQEKKLTAKDVDTGDTQVYSYDKIVIATGASAVLPEIRGIHTGGVFKMRTPGDAVTARDYILKYGVKQAAVIGAGFIGLEVAENLRQQGLDVTVIEFADQVMPNVFDFEMADYIKRHLERKGIRVLLHTKAEEIKGDGRVSSILTSAGEFSCGLVVTATGVRPNTAFLADTGIEMIKGAILVDEKMRTNLEDVYAAGDCAMVQNRLTGKGQWSPMGSSANLEGRTLAKILCGEDKTFPGVLGTSVVKLPELNCGRTGLTEVQAKNLGIDTVCALAVTDDKAHYYPDAAFFATKLIAERKTHRLLGIQVLGPGAVDKMVDIAVTGINMGATLENYENADYAYAPPFSTAIHPFVQAVYILLNKLSGELVSMTPAEYLNGAAEGYTVIDASASPAIPGARFIDLTKVNGDVDGLQKDEKLLLVCTRGKRAYFLQNRLRHFGYKNTVVLEGATSFNTVKVEHKETPVSAEDITRVKALGFLFDKRSANKFNCRVITKNGKITAEESRAISQAAELFGSGEITMTSRMTIEIQGVPFENIEPIREFLGRAGLKTGGTGSKVRPVVSCKGTTCQYGNIDTFALSEEIHRRFYEGYNDVKLPHKFKIAVGGCPNNCVKPDLNDLGIVGQKIPQVDLDKCRGCKVCQIENVCPMEAAKVADGKIVLSENCNNCGRCVAKCPFGAFAAGISGYRIYIGGRWGKKIARGRMIRQVFTDKEQVLSVVEKAILLFREQGITGERFADTVERLGFETVENQLLSNDLLERKSENLASQKHLKGGATC